MFEYETSNDLLLYPFLEDDEGVEEPLFPDEGSGWGALSLAEALLPLVESPPSTPPPQSPWMCYARYKTELCSRYTELGSCKYAERCQFAHGLRDLRVPSRHPKYKTEPCRAFHAGGYCAYGARCLFVHGPKEQRPARPPRSRNVPCRTFRSFGVCPFGARCHFLHAEADGARARARPGPGARASADEKGARPGAREQRPRGALCRTFSAFGFCLYGTRCRFQHCLPSGPLLPAHPPAAVRGPPEGDAFSFSGQHLNDLLLPLAWRLQQLEKTLAWPALSPGVEGEAAIALPKTHSDTCS
ncbi:hypothetical protein ANANG_G00071350 [Anguilla anguilla]|uniref:mRNA decay activator protein ZFP36 n=1 Tax=Anguilla anguilla TaxID=7936 RepID=A0A9D3S7W5_ANGAN|nr:hypothetical protein ANANG_G00071350 [Anguilla anguilla]